MISGFAKRLIRKGKFQRFLEADALQFRLMSSCLCQHKTKNNFVSSLVELVEYFVSSLVELVEYFLSLHSVHIFSQILSWLLKEYSSLSETPDLVINHSYSPISQGSNHLVMFFVIFKVSKISRPCLWSVTSLDIKVCKKSVRITVWGWLVGSLVINLLSCSVMSKSLQPH